MNKISPEDREYWDEVMARHARRQRRQHGASMLRKIGIIALAVVLAASCLVINMWDRTFQGSPEPGHPSVDDSIRRVLDDSIRMNAADIPDSSIHRKRNELGTVADTINKEGGL